MRIYALKVSLDYESVEVVLTRTLKPHSTPAVVLAVDHTSTLLATGAADGNIKVFDIKGGYPTHAFRGPSVLVSALHFFEVASSETVAGKKRRKSKAAAPDESADPATVNFRLASGSQDGKVRVWDLYKRSIVTDLDSHTSDVTGIGYSRAQQTLVTAGRDELITWWDSRTWQRIQGITAFELIESAGFIEDGRLTYTAGANGSVRLWETETGREVTKKQPAKSEEESIVSAIYCPEHSLLICVQVDHTLALYQTPSISSTTIPELEPLEPIRRITGTHDDIIDLAYLMPDRSLLALATNSEDIRIVTIGNSTSIDEAPLYFGQDVGLLKGHDDIIVTLDVDWSGHWVATGAKDNSAKLWRVDPANGSFECYSTFVGHAESVGAVALPKTRPAESSPAFSDPLNHPPAFLVTGSQDLTVKRWDIPRQAQQESKKGLRALFTRKAHDKDINALDVNPTSTLFASASQDKNVKIWSIQEGEVQGILRGHKRGVWSVRFAPIGTPQIQGEEGGTQVAGRGVVLTGSGDKTLKIWSLADYTCLRTFEGHSNSVLKVVWLKMPQEDAKYKHVHVASAAADGLVRVWDANTGECATTLDNHEDRVWALAVNPETNALVSGSGDSTCTLWKDTSSETQTKAAEAARELIEQEQQLENHIHAGSYREAIVLALQLNHPKRLLSLFTKVINSAEPEKGSITGLKAVDAVLADLSDEQIFLLLLRLRDWNTNARTAPVAQRILFTLCRSYPANKFSGLKVKGMKGQKSLKEVLDALKVYTERHYKRIEELEDESYIIEYTLREMDALAIMAPSKPDEDASDDEDGDVDMLE